MKTYLVGGAVRDKLLGIPVKDRDWVVVGSSPDEMKKKGFKQVGKDFPVFIDPKTGEEYALARTESKSGHGYTGFEFDTNPDVTLEEDLARRDLTINAIAQDEDGSLIDPYNGQEDIKNKKLRHVSDAFSEDPLRVLRVARFYATFAGDDFIVVPETVDKIKEIVESGELEHLTPERKWLEIYKTGARCPITLHMFFRFLVTHNAKNILFPEINDEFTLGFEGGIYPSIDPIPTRTDIENVSIGLYNWLSSPDAIKSFCQRLKVPNECKELTLLLSNCDTKCRHYQPSDTDEYDIVLSLIKKIDIRKKDRLESFKRIVWDSSDDSSSTSKIFFEDVIDKLNDFKLSEEDQKKPGLEIKKIIENAHREIAQDSIRKFLNKSD